MENNSVSLQDLSGASNVNMDAFVKKRFYNDYGDDQYVPDITIEWMYKPHVVTAIFACVGALLYQAWSTSDEFDTVKSVKTALLAMVVFVVILGMMVFPSGPFIRPHPVVWRAVFAIGVLYELLLIFLLFLSKHDARALMKYIDPKLGVPLVQKSYGENCEFTLTNVWGAFDMFIAAHFIGWFMKAFIIRDVTLCWVVSIGWELVEVGFKHMLPNFDECWWDSWLLDVLICNGLGIYFGAKTCEYFEMMDYNWKGIHRYPTYAQKAQRVLKQFLPESWMNVRWKATESMKRLFGVHCLILLFCLQELNTFFLKTLLWLPPPHYLNGFRLAIWFGISLPCFRQIYLYMSDPTVKSVGRQTFLCVVILSTEVQIICKFGRGEFNQPMSDSSFAVVVGLITAYLVYTVGMVVYILRRHPTVDLHGQVASTLETMTKEIENEVTVSVTTTTTHAQATDDDDKQPSQDPQEEQEQTSTTVVQRRVTRSKSRSRVNAETPDAPAPRRVSTSKVATARRSSRVGAWK